MWTKTKIHINPVDSKIVTRDFIVAEMTEGSYIFLHKDNNPFNKDLWASTLHLFKVHKKHPLRIFSSNTNHTDIYPANERRKKYQRIPAEVFRDRMDYDMATFMIVPYENPDSGKYWKKFLIEDGFVSKTDDQICASISGNI